MWLFCPRCSSCLAFFMKTFMYHTQKQGFFSLRQKSNLWQFSVMECAELYFLQGADLAGALTANTLPHLLLCSTALHNKLPLHGTGEGKASILLRVGKGEQAWCSPLLAGCADLLDHSPFLYKCAPSTGDSPLPLRKPSSDGGHTGTMAIQQWDSHHLTSATCDWEQMRGKLNS